MIAPPTPPQLEQDKAAIDESFNRAFALIDQLASDTAALKASEAERTEKLDTTLKDVDTVIADLKAANTRREVESRIIADQVQGLKELVPKALEGWKANGDARLDELSQEMQSLKRLIENRVGRSASNSTPTSKGYPPHVLTGNSNSRDNNSTATAGNPNPTSGAVASEGIPAPAPGIDASKGDVSPPKRGGLGSDRRAAIPAWQMAAASKGYDNGATEAAS